MNFLILHHNFPGQFRALLQGLTANGHTVHFLCQTRFTTFKHPKAYVYKIKQQQSKPHSTLEGHFECGLLFANAMLALQKNGFLPDLIISHSGWGCGQHIHDIFPAIPVISYLEWWFNPHNNLHSAQPPLTSHRLSFANNNFLRNRALLWELINSDRIITPTYWQLSQLPAKLQKITSPVVIHEGVNLSTFTPNVSLRHPGKVIITYATRGLEPMRYFTEFVIGVTYLLQHDNDVIVCIAGDDRVCYGLGPCDFSYKNWAINYFKSHGVIHRVRFLGFLNHANYIRLLQTSDIHFYFSRPFVCSWSLLDAMAIGCRVVVNQAPNIIEIVGDSASHLVSETLQDNWWTPLFNLINIAKSDKSWINTNAINLVHLHYNATDSYNSWFSQIRSLVTSPSE